MTPVMRLTAAALAVAVAACGADSGVGTPGGGATETLPLWQLEDVQPQSPRTGQTYGLDTFAGKVVVVSLLEGF